MFRAASEASRYRRCSLDARMQPLLQARILEVVISCVDCGFQAVQECALANSWISSEDELPNHRTRCVARGGLVRWASHVPCKHQECEEVEHAHHTEAFASFHLLHYLLPFSLPCQSQLAKS